MVRKHTLHFLFLTFPYFLASPFLILLLPQNGNKIYSSFPLSHFSLFPCFLFLPPSPPPGPLLHFESLPACLHYSVTSLLFTCLICFVFFPLLFFFFPLFFVGTALADFLIRLFPPACLFLSSNCLSLISFFVLSLTLSPSPLLW